MIIDNQDEKPHSLDASSKGEGIFSATNLPNRAFDIVAIAASAGGLKALSGIFNELPGDFPVGIVVVQHIPPNRESLMAKILNRRTPLLVKQAEDREPLNAGTVYIAPSNFHLRVEPKNVLCLTQSEKVHFVRPAAEVLFSSVAKSYKDRAIAVVLTGGDSDGSGAVKTLHKVGSKVIAQDRETSEVFGMPAAAINTGCVDWVLPLDKIASALKNLVATGNIGREIL